MADSYTVLWTNDRCRWLKQIGEVGKPLRVLFGGPHTSLPSLTRFGVRPGDWVYPVHVSSGILYIIARMRIRAFVTVEEYVQETLELPEEWTRLHLWDLEARLQAEQPQLGHILPYGCITEVALGEQGTPISFDLAVPPPVLESLRFRSRRGERALRHVENGRLKHIISLQGGVYRLSVESARAFEALLRKQGYTSPGEEVQDGQD